MIRKPEDPLRCPVGWKVEKAPSRAGGFVFDVIDDKREHVAIAFTREMGICIAQALVGKQCIEQMTAKPKEHSITDDELTEVVDFIKFWTTAFRNGCSEKDRSRLSGIIRILDTIRTRSHLHLAPVQQEKYTGACAVQDNCTDYADFVESILDEIDNDDDIPCPIKCAKRMNPNQLPEAQQHIEAAIKELKSIRGLYEKGLIDESVDKAIALLQAGDHS